MVSGGRLGSASGSWVASFESPGRRMLPPRGNTVDVESVWCLRYAAELNPLSAVCLNHVGSFELSDWAI